MQQEGIKPNQFTFVNVLRACARLAALDQGRQIHAHIIGTEFESNVFVGSALVDMYAKCRNIDDARNMFEKMSERDAVSWNAMIAGYALNGHGEEALNHFNHMQNAGIKPYQATFSSVLMACATLIFLEPGKQVHGHTIKTGLESDVFVGSALLDMYAKCGSIQDAQNVFGKITARDAISWNAMIAGYAHHGLGKEVLRVFKQMKREGMKPNSSTFISVLSACSHAGLVEEGHGHFDSMFRDHEVTPKMEHYACMVDLLGRAGQLSEAQYFVGNMPFEPSPSVWGALLAACRVHGNIELAEHVSERLFELEPYNTGNYVLLSNMYAEAGRWDNVEKVRIMLKGRGLKKNPGCSWIEINNRVHAFRGGDKSHPQSEKIYALLENLAGQMKKAGYEPDTSFVLHDVEAEEKEFALFSHSERLAIAFGILNTGPGTLIQISKNLRVCGDCHTATKFISKIVRREIIVSMQ